MAKHLFPAHPDLIFSTSFSQQHINLFSLITRCQGTYLYKLHGVFSPPPPSLLALESSLVLPPHMVKLGRLTVCDEEQVAECRIEAVQPDLCL